ncbi:hypothetical protein A9Q99_12850 [Gammaproteobacteria bacterium 45_16_T64]|nr:hypothetical protein A9Q99_12850 [Gammaproteobacteria bacterium 45_16_T64]
MGSTKRSSKSEILQDMIGKLTTCFQSLQRQGMSLGSVSKKGNTFWGVLRLIDKHGPMTVPQIALQRQVSRQRIQVMVDEYVGEGYLECVTNPSHKRSKLIALTQAGEIELGELSDAIFGYLDQASNEFEQEELEVTVRVLDKLQRLIELERTQRGD